MTSLKRVSFSDESFFLRSDKINVKFYHLFYLSLSFPPRKCQNIEILSLFFCAEWQSWNIEDFAEWQLRKIEQENCRDEGQVTQRQFCTQKTRSHISSKNERNIFFCFLQYQFCLLVPLPQVIFYAAFLRTSSLLLVSKRKISLKHYTERINQNTLLAPDLQYYN